ncbi:MAG: glycosyltransferase family 4 protein [Candidatus Cryptobacteroides sp.]
MKIVCLLRSLGVGGVERQLTGLASFLKEAGHDVCIMKYLPEDFYEDFLREKNIPVVYIHKGGGLRGLCKRIGKYLQENETDLVISFAQNVNVKACLAKKMYGNFKLIVSERNYTRHLYITDRLRFILYKHADWIVSNNNSQHNLIQEEFPRYKGNSSCIVNFVDLLQFAPPAHKSPSKVKRIAVTARISRRKNIHGLIRAAKVLTDKGYNFIIEWYGVTRESRYFKHCINLISKYDLNGVFELKAATRNVKDIYHNADAFCLPSFREGTSNSIAEAIACGMPVICSDVSDNSLYVKEGENGWLFNPHDRDSIVSAFIKMLSTDADTVKQYGERSREIAQEHLSPERFTKEYLDLIEKIAGSQNNLQSE